MTDNADNVAQHSGSGLRVWGYTSAHYALPILCLLCNLLLVCSNLIGSISTSQSYHVLSERGALIEDRVHLTEVENKYFFAGVLNFIII